MDKIRKNVVRAQCITGIYADEDIEIHIGSHARNTKIKINGRIVKSCTGVYIKIALNQPTMLHLEFRKKKED